MFKENKRRDLILTGRGAGGKSSVLESEDRKWGAGISSKPEDQNGGGDELPNIFIFLTSAAQYIGIGAI